MLLEFDEGHPAFQGHFPGDPLVPGALLLASAVDEIEKVEAVRVDSVTSAKFLKPVRPLDVCALSVQRIDEKTLRLTATVHGENVLVTILNVREREFR